MYSSKTNSTNRIAVGLALLAALLVAMPAAAGTVYVVLASSASENGIAMDTEVVVANPTSDDVEVDMHFIRMGADGADRPEGFEPKSYIVPARTTRVFTDVTVGASRGLLEVTAPSSVGVSARLISTLADGTKNRTAIPVVGSEELVPGGKLHVLNGWLRNETRRTSLGLVNLSRGVNNCLVQTVKPDGNATIPVTNLAIKPVSSMYVEDAMLAAGTASGADMRIQIICDGDAFSYSVVRDIETGAMSTLRPAADGGSFLRPPGAPQQCEDGWVCISRGGIFLIPTRAEPLVKIDFDAPLDAYASFHMRMTVTHGGWSTTNSAGLHSLLWLVPVLPNGKTDWKRTPVYANLRGGNKNLLVNNSILNGVRPTAPAGVGPGQTFIVDILYDPGNRTSRVALLNLDGSVISEVTHGTGGRTFDTSDIVRVEIGLDEAPAGSGYPETRTLGWIYQDLEITVIP